MTLHRFFVQLDLTAEEVISLPEEVSHQITQVLRLKNNDQIILLDNTGLEYLTTITEVNKKRTTLKVVEKRKNNNEPDKKVHLYMALISRDNFELVLQKSVELGISEITPIITERTQFDRKFVEGKLERWQKIIKEAAEQSERGKLPILNQPINFESAITQAQATGIALIASEYERSKKVVIPSEVRVEGSAVEEEKINIFIGPEGGFTEQEIEFAKQQKAKPVSLGKTILRAETAAIVFLAKIF